MHEMTYIWQSQAPVSINMCLTIECLLKECKTEDWDSLGLFSSNGYRYYREFMRIEAEKNILVLRQWTGLYFFLFRKFSKRTNLEWSF